MSGRLTRALTRHFTIPVFTVVAAVSSGLLLLAAAGDIDPSFGSAGIVKTEFSGFDGASAVAVQSDGKIVAAGIANDVNWNPIFGVARYSADGTLDPTFGNGGKVEIDFYASALRVDLAIDSTGRIVVGGSAAAGPFSAGDFAVARLTPSGALDATFGAGGKVTTDFAGYMDEGNAIALQTDGKIVLAGTARLTGQGFGAADIAVVRYNADGTLDTSFDGDGKVTSDFTGSDELGNGAAIQGDGRIVVAGAMSDDFAVVRYTANGALDASFDGDGVVTTDIGGYADEAFAVVIQPQDGMIVVSGGAVAPNAIGWFQDFALVRYGPDGTPDAGFGAGGKVLTDFTGGGDVATDVILQADGKIIAAGWIADPADIELLIDFGVARYDTHGSLDPTFGNVGRVITDLGYIDYGQAVALQADCKIVMAGWSWPAENGDSAFGLVRYDAGGCAATTNPTCPKTQGYWQNNPNAWPVDSLTLGSQTYTKAELLAVLASPTKGDASLTLAQQLIAAMLNVANGSDAAPIAATISHGNSLLAGYPGKLPYSVKTASFLGQQMVADAALLDQYNRGELTGCAVAVSN